MEVNRRLCNVFIEAHPQEAARRLELFPPDTVRGLLATSPPMTVAKVLEHVDPVLVAQCLSGMVGADAAGIISHLPFDFSVAVLRHVPADERNAILDAVTAELSQPLRRLLQYPEGTAGALMDPLSLSVPEDITVGEAIKRAKDTAHTLRYYVYVVDRNYKLVGVVTLRELMHSRPSDSIASIMRRDIVYLRAEVSREEIVGSPYWRNFSVLPVVDPSGIFLGALRYETLHRLQQELSRVTQSEGGLNTALALGELYWIGLAGLLKGMTPTGATKQSAGQTS
ncbi:MAG: CBS domain-containing protein [Gammaproteobacteria bacterium]|nr:CBS domain-containing protein [Gammaproteobacteria bacterium]